MNWLDWSGGAIPVTADTYVGIVFRNGSGVVAQKAGSFKWEHAPGFDSADPRHAGWWDIVRYQVWP